MATKKDATMRKSMKKPGDRAWLWGLCALLVACGGTELPADDTAPVEASAPTEQSEGNASLSEVIRVTNETLAPKAEAADFCQSQCGSGLFVCEVLYMSLVSYCSNVHPISYDSGCSCADGRCCRTICCRTY